MQKVITLLTNKKDNMKQQKTTVKREGKEKPKESEKHSTIVPELPMKNGIMTLENNAKTSRAVVACGVRLAEQIDREGMNDETERMAADYIASCGADGVADGYSEAVRTARKGD